MGRLIWQFIKHWWAYMSCALWTFLAFWQLFYGKSNRVLIWIYLSLAVLSLILGIATTAYEQYLKRRECEQRLEEAINTNRPEVFATLSFGPGRVGTGSIGLQNCGNRDARNVQIIPFSLSGVNQGQEETKALAFPHFSHLPRRERPDYPAATINNMVDLDHDGQLAFFLSTWCDRWEQTALEFEVSVQWFDSSGNQFVSTSQMSYSRGEHTCRTVTGFVKHVRPKA
jgi:hypothetical protein